MIVDRVRLPRRLLWTVCAVALGASTLLAGCHPRSNVTYGTGVVTMGDVNGDFSAYIVTIDSMTLTRNDGLVIEPLSEPEIVDLAKLQNVTELVENPAIPIGTYVSLTMVLDYTSAQIYVDINGAATAASAVDTTGTAMLTSTLTVTFDPDHPLIINAQQCTRIHLDINLAASNTINISGSTVTDTVQPFMTATPAAEDSTVMRARGILVTVQPQTSDFIVNMRPFSDLISALGAMTINTNSATYFNINGVTYTGAAGLAAMESLQEETSIAAYGTLGSFSTITPSFNATAVYAGASLESPLEDFLTGVLAARDGDTLTMHGASYLNRDGALQYYNELPIKLSSETIVSEDGVAANGLSPQSISVGQLVTVSGQAILDTTTDLVTELDATTGQVRLQSTPVWGTLKSGAAGSMVLDALSFANFEVPVFGFAGTGPNGADNADPFNYLIDTPGINLSSTPVGTLLYTNGIVAPYGAAPPDFTATSVVVGAATPQQLVVEWEDGGAIEPFTSYTISGIVVDLADAKVSSTIRYIATGPVKVDLKTLPASPTIVFADNAALTLAVGNNAAIAVFNGVANFIAYLKTTLNGTNAIYRLVCVGQYSATTNTFIATQVAVNLQQ